jgi:hypothetical protein
MGIHSSMATVSEDSYERIFGHKSTRISGLRERIVYSNIDKTSTFGKPVQRSHMSMAIHPSQVAEHSKLFPNIQLKQNSGGFFEPVTKSVQEAHRYAKSRGFEDMN